MGFAQRTLREFLVPLMMGGPLRAVVLLTSVVAAGAGTAAHSWTWPSRARLASLRSSTAQSAAPEAQSPAPELTVMKAPLRAPAGPAADTVVSVTGRKFTAGLTMTLTSPFYVFTFGPMSLEGVGAESFRFDAGSIPDGTYDLTVSNGAGRRSNAVKFVMLRK
jgi:hypothetical protein